MTPITIESAAVSFEGGVDIDASTSSRYLTALLLTLAGASNKSAYVEVRVGEQLISRPYIDIMLDLLASFGVPIERLDASTFRWQHSALPPWSSTILGVYQRHSRLTSTCSGRSAARMSDAVEGGSTLPLAATLALGSPSHLAAVVHL
ncbi:hypothetical protein [Cupriavidus sp. CP313]